MNNYATVEIEQQLFNVINTTYIDMPVVDDLLKRFIFSTDILDQAALLASSLNHWEIVNRLTKENMSESLCAILECEYNEREIEKL